MSFSRTLKSRLRTLFNKNRIHLFKAIVPLKRYKIEDSIIISSETRAGSTWLMELLSSLPDTIINWEPLHETKGVVPNKYNWGERPFIPENETDIDAKNLMDKLLRLKVYSANSVRYCKIKELVTTKRVLTKMVRSNLMLPWLTKNFEFNHKPIYLLRHPIALSKSQIRNIPEAQGEFDDFKVPETINNERYIDSAAYFKNLKTPLERQVALWCLHNMDIINHPESGKKWVVVFYEELLLDPEKEMKRMGKEMNLDIPIDHSKFDKPSKSDFFNEFKNDKEKQLSKWKTDMSEKEIEKFQDIFDHFGLTIYRADEIMPRIA